MSVDDRIPYIRVLNANDHSGDELWVMAAVVRLLNVIRVWCYEIEVRLAKAENQERINSDDVAMFDESAKHLIKLIKQAYLVLQGQDLKSNLAFFEGELFKFETLYLTTNLCLIINEQTVEFQPDRYEFLRHGLHGVLHDLSQPLSALMSMVVLVEAEDESEVVEFRSDAMQVVSQCKAQLERGFELVRGSFALEEMTVDELVQVTRETMGTLLKPDNIDLELSQRVNRGTVIYSRMWYRGLLANIVDNANKSFWIKGEHLGHGDFPRKLYMEFNQDKLPGEQPSLAIVISDTGVGFAQELIDEGFVQGKSDWSDRQLLGQGVGMAVHVEYIKKLRGEIVLANVSDHGQVEGARMIIKLPLV